MVTLTLRALPDHILNMRGEVRALTEAIARYQSPLPSVSADGKSAAECQNADTREIRYRRRLYVALSQISTRWVVPGQAGNGETAARRRGLVKRYLPSTPQRGDRKFQTTRLRKEQDLGFAAELDCLVFPAFGKALEDYRAVMRHRKRGGQMENRARIEATSVAYSTFFAVIESRMAELVCHYEDDIDCYSTGLPTDQRIVVTSIGHLRQQLDVDGLACLDWLLGGEDTLTGLRQPVRTFIAPFCSDSRKRQPRVASAAFAASITESGGEMILKEAKKYRKRLLCSREFWVATHAAAR